jgi:hypothetical protein
MGMGALYCWTIGQHICCISTTMEKKLINVAILTHARNESSMPRKPIWRQASAQLILMVLSYFLIVAGYPAYGGPV